MLKNTFYRIWVRTPIVSSLCPLFERRSNNYIHGRLWDRCYYLFKSKCFTRVFAYFTWSMKIYFSSVKLNSRRYLMKPMSCCQFSTRHPHVIIKQAFRQRTGALEIMVLLFRLGCLVSIKQWHFL